jgi:hypothetical protein
MKTAALLNATPASPSANIDSYEASREAAPVAAEPVIRALDADWIPQMLELQHAHGDGQVVQRTAAQLRDHFERGQQALGAFVGDRLVGQALITTKAVAAESLSMAFARAAGCSVTLGNRDFICSTLGGVLVAPDMRGKSLMGRLIDRWVQAASDGGCDLLHARVRVGNIKSWKNFLSQGLHITDTGPSPDDADYNIYSMYRPLNAAFLTDAHDAKTAPVDAAEIIEHYLATGYIGSNWDGETGMLKMIAFKGLHP